MNQIEIEEKSTLYHIKLTYHSDLMCQNYDTKITGVSESDGRVTLRPWENGDWDANLFEFSHSDPDRVIAVAQMMMSFAQMVKKENQKSIDTNANA